MSNFSKAKMQFFEKFFSLSLIVDLICIQTYMGALWEYYTKK